jgi:hypothetical protein
MTALSTFSNLDLLRAYTAQFAVELGPDDEFLPHEPINAADAAELVRKWSTGSVVSELYPPEEAHDIRWSALAALADDYGVPVDEFLGAVHFVSQHNGAYKDVPRLADRIGCAMGEITRVLGAFSELVERARGTETP